MLGGQEPPANLETQRANSVNDSYSHQFNFGSAVQSGTAWRCRAMHVHPSNHSKFAKLLRVNDIVRRNPSQTSCIPFFGDNHHRRLLINVNQSIPHVPVYMPDLFFSSRTSGLSSRCLLVSQHCRPSRSMTMSFCPVTRGPTMEPAMTSSSKLLHMMTVL